MTNKVYWQYETCIKMNNCVSIRSTSGVSFEQYKEFLMLFLSKYCHRIQCMRDISKLYDDTFCCIIELKGRDNIDFSNHGLRDSNKLRDPSINQWLPNTISTSCTFL